MRESPKVVTRSSSLILITVNPRAKEARDTKALLMQIYANDMQMSSPNISSRPEDFANFIEDAACQLPGKQEEFPGSSHRGPGKDSGTPSNGHPASRALQM